MTKITGPPIKTAIVLPDLQLPFEDTVAVNAVEQLLKDLRVDYWIQLGDFMDFNYISRWTTENLKVLTGSTFVDDYKYANEFLDRHIKLVRGKNPDAEMVIIEGNHDFRPKVVIEKDPRYEGMIEFDRNLRLKEKNIKFIPFWSTGDIYTIGKANFIHGYYTNDAHAKKHVQNYGKNIFYGHLHDVQTFSIAQSGDHNSLVGQSLGCLCKYQLDYVRGKPVRWQQAFAVFHFFPNGDFTYNVVRIVRGRFIYNGKVYDGNNK